MNHFVEAVAMRHTALLLFSLQLFLILTVAQENSSSYVTCFRCLANETNCRETCSGKYCYKIEMSIEGQQEKFTKRGCLSRKDELSKVGQCTERPATLPGGTIMTENFCICQSDRCNGAVTWWSSVAAFFAAALAYFWND